MLDGGFDLDIDGACANIDEADVVVLYFPLLHTTLLVDARPCERLPAWVGLTSMARNAGERLEWLTRRRPQLPRPRSLTSIPWPRRIGSLEQAALWERLLARLGAAGAPQALARARACLAALYAIEHAELGRAIRGERYETVWRNPGAAPD